MNPIKLLNNTLKEGIEKKGLDITSESLTNMDGVKVNPKTAQAMNGFKNRAEKILTMEEFEEILKIALAKKTMKAEKKELRKTEKTKTKLEKGIISLEGFKILNEQFGDWLNNKGIGVGAHQTVSSDDYKSAIAA